MISGSAFDVHFPTAATLRAAALVCHVSVASPSLASPQCSLSLSSHISLSLSEITRVRFSHHISLCPSQTSSGYDLFLITDFFVSPSHHRYLCLSQKSSVCDLFLITYLSQSSSAYDLSDGGSWRDVEQ